MSNYKKHFERELKILNDNLEEGDSLVIKDFIPLIEQALDVFSEQGHSGGSAPFYANALGDTIKKVMLFEPLSPITGDDDEWGENNMDGKTLQNKRLSSVFKEGKDGKPYYIDAIVFKGQNDCCFTGSSIELKDGSTISSRQFIKLPFTPKTFYIDVIETEWADKDETVEKEGGGWWTSVVKDEKQLNEVFEYYDKE